MMPFIFLPTASDGFLKTSPSEAAVLYLHCWLDVRTEANLRPESLSQRSPTTQPKHTASFRSGEYLSCAQASSNTRIFKASSSFPNLKLRLALAGAARAAVSSQAFCFMNLSVHK